MGIVHSSNPEFSRRIIEKFLHKKGASIAFGLTSNFQFNYGDLKKLIELVTKGEADVREFHIFLYGRVLAHLPNEELEAFFEDLLTFGSQ